MCCIILSFLPFIGTAADLKEDTLVSKVKEITVTALRYRENIMLAPLSVSIFDNNRLQNYRGVGMDEIINYTPGVLAQTRSGSQDVRITIRGFGARGAGNRSNAGTSRGIKFYTDGIPETEPDGRTSFDFIDLSLANSIEVIRSNSSAIWGNAAGGVVSISTVPLEKNNFLSAEAMAGSFGFQKFVLHTQTNVGTNRIFANIIETKGDGWRTHSDFSKFLFDVGVINEYTPETRLAIFISGVNSFMNLPGPLTQAQIDSVPKMANPAYNAQDEFRDNKLARIGVTLEHSFSGWDIKGMSFVNSKIITRSERNTYRDFTRYYLGGSLNAKHSDELFSGSVKNTILLGTDEAYQDGAILFYYLTKATRDSLKADKNEGANSFGAYIQDEMLIGESLNILIGVRWDNIAYHNKLFFDGGSPQHDPDEIFTYSQLSPKLGLTFRLNEKHSIFANYGSGVEVPAGNETDPPSNGLFNTTLKPIISQTIELGFKNYENWTNDFLKYANYELAAYFITVENELIPYSGGAYYFSAAESQRLGAEIGLGLETSFGLRLDGAFTYSINKYQNYKIDSVYAATADYSKNKIAGMPQFYYSFALSYHPEFIFGLFAEISTQGVSKYFADDANKVEVPGYNVINARIGFDKHLIIVGVKLKPYFIIGNITDSKYAASAFINPDTDKATKKPIFLEAGLPRNFSIGVSVGI